MVRRFVRGRARESKMAEVKLFKRAEMRFEPYGGPPGQATIARLVGPELSSTMGAGLGTFDDCSVEWTVLYDELVVVLEGVFRLRLADGIVEGRPGDVIWIPENTALRYEGERAVVFYALYPVDWRKRHAL
jgi:ethanolamine utilization protein EutQ